MDDKEHFKLTEKMKLASDYDAMRKTPGFKNLEHWLFTEQQTLLTELLLEEHQRVSRASSDTLRGRLQQCRDFSLHINAVYREGLSASEKIAKHSNTL